MLKLILTVWILVEAIRRKCYRWIPVCVLMALYWAADAGFLRLSEFISMAGTIKRLILLVLTVLMFLLWRKKQASGAALIFCVLAVLSRFGWKMIANRYLDAMLQSDADYLYKLRSIEFHLCEHQPAAVISPHKRYYDKHCRYALRY